DNLIVELPDGTVPKCPRSSGSDHVVGGHRTTLLSHSELKSRTPCRDDDGSMSWRDFPVDNSCIWLSALPRCPASQVRKPIRRGRCASLPAFLPEERWTITPG